MHQISHPPYAGLQLDQDDAFRLIRLQPGQGDEPITIRLQNSELSSSPPYEALSYVWGDTSHMATISILSPDSDNESVQILVTANCHAALHRLRHPNTPRTLWVDAICINQSQVAERNHQLALMSRIYRTARRVAVYLGEAADASDAVMRWIHQLHWPSDAAARTCSAAIEPPAARAIRPHHRHIAALLRRSWFHRVWVLQEIALARASVVVCGNEVVPWECFLAFRYWIWSAQRTDLWHLASVMSFSRPIIGSYPSWGNLLEVLAATRHCGASDPRDKLYALLPLLDRAQESPGVGDSSSISRIKPDYGLSSAVVFTDLATRLLEIHGLELLRWVVSPAAVAGLPSWVPDWSVNAQSRQFETPLSSPFRAGFRHETTFHCDQWKSGLAPKARKTPTPKYTSTNGEERVGLNIQGVRLGSIMALGDVCHIGNDYPPCANWAGVLGDTSHIEDQASHANAKIHGKCKSEYTLFRRTMITCTIDLQNTVNSYVEKTESHHGDVDVVENPCSSGEGGLSHDTFRRFPEFERHPQVVFSNCDGRRMFVTDTDYIGLGPAAACAGDVVMVIEDASVPFVLRPHNKACEVAEKRDNIKVDESNDDLYNSVPVFQLLGQAYIQGVMGGEVWDNMGKETSQLHVQEFMIH